MTEQSEYTTRVTYLGDRYGCRVLRGGRVVVEGQCQTRDQIGATFRDLFRTGTLMCRGTGRKEN